ncbi:MAG: beta-propeller fold lactonase family protein [Acidobacteriota bacterium]|nr:MAG: beta-propeller fold lactonase family protein [Acidobacteriota bacterium]
MSRTYVLLFITVLTFSLMAVSAQEAIEPVYVGARVCATCHNGPEMGHQFSRWLMTKHARAYAILSEPDAEKIAELSGVPQDPQESTLCLGCHATAADAEEWELDETFRIEDGVQCEKCHGPGSEYMDAEVMKDRTAAVRAGLRIPTRETCTVCHHEKGSHVAVHQLPKLDREEAWKEIAHPAPESPKWEERLLSAPDPEPDSARSRIVGVQVCGECHTGKDKSYQYSRWKLTPHARAYAVLATPEAYEMAQAEGIEGSPQQAEQCLSCHTTNRANQIPAMASYSIDEGVGCESCHGPGSEYSYEAIMIDRTSAESAGLLQPTEATCRPCHENAHGKPFDYQVAWPEILHSAEQTQIAEKIRYKTPLNLALSPGGRELYLACEASSSVVVVDVATRKKVAEIQVGGQPHDVTFSPDGKLAYVSNRLDDTISVLDVASRTHLRTSAVGDEPHGVLTDREGKHLFVLNTSEDSISILETENLTEIKRLSASRNPWSLSLSPDGSTLLVTNTLAELSAFRTPSVSELTAIEVERGIVKSRLRVPGSNLLQGVAWHPSGEFAFFTMNRTKNLVPMTRLMQGWTITNGLGIAWANGRVDQVLLDEPDQAFPDPADVAFTPDGKLALVSSSGSNRIAVVDVERLIEILRSASDEERETLLPNHLGTPTEFVIKHLKTRHSPRGIVVTPDGSTAFVANALDDTVTVIDLASLETDGTIDLGGPKEVTQVRFGEQVFHSANIAFHRQFSCHTCHPDGHVDGITYDIEPDGVGVSPVDNRTLRGILDTAPFKWEGTNPSLQRQCGPRLAVFFTRIDPFTPEELAAIDLYIATIPRPPNRYRPLGSPLSPAQRRGKVLFERRFTNDGRLIPAEQQCQTCHPAPLYTNHQVVDVGTKMTYDRDGRFDVPHLNNIYDSAPYLHNGIAHTLEEIWTVYNPNDRHGVTNDMTKDQLNDLIEYIKTF